MFVTSGYWIPKYSLHEVNYIEKHVHFFTEVSPSCSYLKNLKPFGAYVRCLFPVFFWNNQEMGNCIRCSSAALPVSHSEVYSSRFESNPMNTLCTKEAGLWQLWQRMRDHWDHDTSASQVSKIAMQDLPCHGQIIDIMPSQFHVFRFFKYILWFFMMGVMPSHCFPYLKCILWEISCTLLMEISSYTPCRSENDGQSIFRFQAPKTIDTCFQLAIFRWYLDDIFTINTSYFQGFPSFPLFYDLGFLITKI